MADQPEFETILKSASQSILRADTLTASALREAIIKGILAPGQEIDEELVARNLNISRMPVRQAIGILEAEGLVKRRHRKGAIVTELTIAEIEELYNIRSCLEGLAVKKAVPNYTEEHIESLRDCLETMNVRSDAAVSYLELNNKFHMMLYEPCEWDYLLNLIIRHRNNAARYMLLAHEALMRRARRSVKHQSILKACERRDAEKASEMVHQHIIDAMETLLTSLTSQQTKQTTVAEEEK